MIIGFYIDKYFEVLGESHEHVWYLDKKAGAILLKYEAVNERCICFCWDKSTRYPVSDVQLYACIEFMKMLHYEPST